MTETLSDLAHALIDAARAAGADAADALATRGTSVSVAVRDGALEQAERAESVDIGLRVLIGHRQACVSASDTKTDTIRTMAERAVAMAREAPEDANIGLANPDQLATDTDTARLELHDPEGEPETAWFEDAARAAEAAALAVDGVSQVQSAATGHSRTALHLAASNGFSAGYTRTGTGLSCVAITGEGTAMERDYFGESRIYAADLPDPEDVGRIAAERTVARSGARKPPTGRFPVLYDERISNSLIGHLVSAANGAMIARGSSWLRDAQGERILPESMSLIEEPHRVRSSASKLFDAEGLPTATRALVQDGQLQGWTLDLATARKLGLTSTASASRSTSSPPSPSVGNLRLDGPQTPRDALLREMGTGLLVTSLIGSSINSTTGDYSRGASGFWVENGEITYPVNECTLAGNLRDMLGTLRMADDARPWTSRVVPSLLVEGLTLAGE